MRLFLCVVVAGLTVLPVFGQVDRNPVPAQYPPGTPPLGRNPGDNSGSIPRREKKKKGSTPKEELPTISAQGVTVENNGKQIVIHTADGRWLTMTIDSGTKWIQSGADIKPDKVVPRTLVKTESAEDGEAFLTALTVELVGDAPNAPEAPAAGSPASSAAGSSGDSGDKIEHQAEQEDAELTNSKKPLDVPDAPDHPVLRRVKPKQSGTTAAATARPDVTEAAERADGDQQDFTIGENKPIRTANAGGPGSEVLQRSMAWSETFNQGLPNYLCRQVTTRYYQQSKGDDWSPQDVVTANIVYQDGHENYRDVMVGNKKVTDMTKSGGTWSTGEFASMLMSVFYPSRQTKFKYFRTQDLHDLQAAIFDFKVTLPNSDWRIIVGGQTLMPSYSGSIWVEKATGIVRRLEQEAKNIPKDFPMDEIQSAVDYDEVSLGTSKFLLPVHAENISCQRGTNICTKNVIDFRDYHKFAGESTIKYK